MKKVFFVLAIVSCLSACQKDRCRRQQTMDLQNELELFQKQVSNTNLTPRQIAEIIAQHDERQRKILAECR